jgi:hypothetical protein
MRKIVQIASAYDVGCNRTITRALCDDGTLWSKIDSNEHSKWRMHISIPQVTLDEVRAQEWWDGLGEMGRRHWANQGYADAVSARAACDAEIARRTRQVL